MKANPYKVFVAFPFDAASKPMFEKVLRNLKHRFKGRFEFVYGNNSVIPPSPEFLSRQMFKAQNTDLLRQFLSNIKSADVVVADLTHNNPNVHVELGIAITLNKNILRMSSRALTEVGSDVRGYEVNQYSDAADLQKKIQSYLSQFLKVKNLPLNKDAQECYSKLFGNPETLVGPEGRGTRTLDLTMRDGSLRMQFRFESVTDDNQWVGVRLRCATEHPFGDGYLLYVRQNGEMELVAMPVQTKFQTRRYKKLELQRDYKLECHFEGSRLIAWLNDEENAPLTCDTLVHQSPGKIAIHCLGSTVIVRDVEAVCRDTIDFTRIGQ